MAISTKSPKWKARPSRYKRTPGESGAQVRKTGSYIWRVPPEFSLLTRTEHLALDGYKFSWDNPPIVNARTGARGHPGHDGNCRCVAEPVSGE